LASHPYADELIICLEKYCSGRFDSNFGHGSFLNQSTLTIE
jgi:hypothetical protein